MSTKARSILPTYDSEQGKAQRGPDIVIVLIYDFYNQNIGWKSHALVSVS